ncbi:MAG: cation transporter [Lachnospiraceae bacterium]|nr:cation transporter [Lachnospiraceae bacterium]
MRISQENKKEIFENLPVPEALLVMAVPTVISQLINLIYNMVDAYFIGRTGNSYMMGATTLTLALVMMNVALSNIFGIGGGSLVARLMGAGREEEARHVSAYSFRGALTVALCYALLIGLFTRPILLFLGASDNTLNFAVQYTQLVLVLGSVPNQLAAVLAHLLRNTGHSAKASLGLSGGGILNMILDPLFMFVILPPGYEVVGAALATFLSNLAACSYLLLTYRKASAAAPLSMDFKAARLTEKISRRQLFSVGIPSAILTGLFDAANISANKLAAAHSDLVLAGLGITLKVERVPNAVCIGLCQGAMPIIAYNFASGNRERMKKTIDTARLWGLIIAACAIVLFQLFAEPATRLFLNQKQAADAVQAVTTISFAAMFLRIRCLASPVQFLNYHSSFCLQAMGDGKATMLHSVVRELCLYIPAMLLLDSLFGEKGLASALPAAEALSAVFALILLHRTLKKAFNE